MKQCPLHTVFLVYALLFACNLSAQTTLVMVTETWPPFRMDEASEGSELGGIDIDVVRQLEKILGVKIEIKRHPGGVHSR